MPTTPDGPASRLILVTDAHVDPAGESASEFFRMLERLEGVAGDIVFLGDIFDLWIALDPYETAVHRRFLAWCRRQKRTRCVGFMEGNHEFFVARGGRAACFSWCTDRPWRREGGVLFVHGDRIDRRDIRHLAFRGLTRNPLSIAFLRLLPGGPAFARGIKRLLERPRAAPPAELPAESIGRFAAARRAAGSHTLLVGHFHREGSLPAGPGGTLYLLPDWRSSRRVSLYDPAGRTVASRHWREIA
jgi:UDP-2,3-diacylglucosamine pyrophosphatase LpxH